MDLALADAHIHLVDLLDRDPGFPSRLSSPEGLGRGWTCCAASHDSPEWELSEALRAVLPPFAASFGIHPQWPVWKNAELLERLAAGGRIQAIGEAGFDFFGDVPERVRRPENEGVQRAVFEFQLELAEARSLPLLLHLRKAMDLAFAYAPRLRRLPAAIFHSYSGTARDAESLLAKGVNAYFSFGTPVLNGNKRAVAACAALPPDRLLAETDAPWQPPRLSLRSGRDYCRAEDIELVIGGIASLRGIAPAEAGALCAANFRSAYGL
jgi:TatD DNase family protein